LRRFIPQEITIASKFGFFREPKGRPRSAQLHECGIIYQPGAPYVLCVMTRAENCSDDRMAEVLANVSRIVWEVKTQDP